MTIVDDILSALGLGDSKPPVDSARQLEQAQREQAQRRVTPEMERQAREKGFRNYEQYLQWERQRANRTGGTVEGGERRAPASVKTAMSWHPKVLLDYVNQAIVDATKKD